MSPSKAKSKERSAMRAAKEQPKASSKPSAAPANTGNGSAASAYNPLSGTFHTLDTVPSTCTPTHQSNGRFGTIDETEEHSGSSIDTTAEYDSLSNNDSCSGESEDQQKEKNTASNTGRIEPIPGSDIDKREKARLNNEKKHQRQRERRALELHERCCSYLTSRKLESLAQKLVVMGFTSEQATMALIHNEGRVEESALWILEGGEESKRQAASNLDTANPKIDITYELAKISELELSFKCTKQEIERIVVACEGDLVKAEEDFKAQKQDSVVATPNLEEYDQPSVSANGYHHGRLAASSQNSTASSEGKVVAPASIQLQRRDDRDLNYANSTITGATQIEEASRNLPPALRKVQPKPDWMKPQAAVPPLEKRWSSTSSKPTPYFLASPLQVAAAQAKPEARFVATGVKEVKDNLLPGTLREPILMMQRQQSSSSRQNVPPASVGLSASPPASSGWYPTGTNVTTAMDIMKMVNAGLAAQQLRNTTLAGANSQQLYPQDHRNHHQFISSIVDTGGSGWRGGPYNVHGGTTSRSSSSSSLAVPSSLGLFSGWGSSGLSGSSSPVDWSTRGSTIPQCDYTSIDWSLDSTQLLLPSSAIKGERLYDNSWHASSYVQSKAGERPVVNGGVCIMGMQEGGMMVDGQAPTAGSHEWTSPFAGKDLFRVPRQFVTSPSPYEEGKYVLSDMGLMIFNCFIGLFNNFLEEFCLDHC